MVSDQDHVLGEAHLALNDCESAKADFEKTFQLDPENKVLVLFFFDGSKLESIYYSTGPKE